MPAAAPVPADCEPLEPPEELFPTCGGVCAVDPDAPVPLFEEAPPLPSESPLAGVASSSPAPHAPSVVTMPSTPAMAPARRNCRPKSVILHHPGGELEAGNRMRLAGGELDERDAPFRMRLRHEAAIDFGNERCRDR